MKSAIRAAVSCAAAGLVLAAAHAAQADTVIPGNMCASQYNDKVGWSGGTMHSQWQNAGSYVTVTATGVSHGFWCPIVRNYSAGGLDHATFYVYNANGADPVACTMSSYSSFGTYYGGVQTYLSSSGYASLYVNTNTSAFPEQTNGFYVSWCTLRNNDKLFGVQYTETPTP